MTISIKDIALSIASCLFGFLASMLISNHTTANAENFTTSQLLGFVFSILLSIVSTVLAIVAIWAGKNSESAIVEKSNESHRMQSELFAKTQDALSRIASSTGVTEKRIEDIIQGRVGDISAKIFQATAQSKSLVENPREIQELIKRTLMDSLGSNDKTIYHNLPNLVETKNEDPYQTFHQTMIDALERSSNGVVLHSGHGQYDANGYMLFDLVTRLNDNQVVGLSALERSSFGGNQLDPQHPQFSSRIMAYLQYVAKAIDQRVVDKVFFLIEADVTEEQILNAQLESISGFLAIPLGDKVSLVGVKQEEIENRLASLLQKNSSITITHAKHEIEKQKRVQKKKPTK